MDRLPNSTSGTVAFVLALTMFLVLPFYFSKQQYKAVATDGATVTQDDKGAKAPAVDKGKGGTIEATPSPTPAYTSEQEEIMAYVRGKFGSQADNAFKVISCESKWNTNASGTNTNGTVDTGLFQVNSLWAQPVLLTDWKFNVDIAYKIYQRSGWNAWSCVTKWGALN